MNPLNILRDFDTELYDYFEKELEDQRYTLSFIPDENSISPVCSAMIGNVLINAHHNTLFQRNANLEEITARRICEVFKCEHANVRPITIEAASRVVFSAVTERGDVVMSLDLRKKEHCNSESYVYQFVNFGIDPETYLINYDVLEKKVLEHKPKLIIVSPVNYAHDIDYARVSAIAKKVDAILWCDISQVAGFVAAEIMDSPVKYADVVTFTAHGALQGPQCSIVMCTNKYASAIDRAAIAAGHNGLRTAELAALCVRLAEMKTPQYRNYCETVEKNAESLAKGLISGGLHLVGKDVQSHFVVVDMRNCAMSARGALEGLAECGVMVRMCQVQTEDPNVRFDALRFSLLPTTTRGLDTESYGNIGVAIANFILNPSEANQEILQTLVRETTISLPIYSDDWLTDNAKRNLEEANYLNNNMFEGAHSDFRIKKVWSLVKNRKK